MVGVEEIAEELERGVVMAKKETEFISQRDTVGGLVPIEERGPVVPVASYGKTRGYLQDDRWLPSWLVWLRRRRGLVLALLALASALAAARWLLLAEK